MGSSKIVGFIGAVVSILAQLMFAPHLNVGGATPSFILAFFLPFALLSTPKPQLFLAVVLGLIFDFSGGGPVGAYLLLLTVLSLAIPFFTSNSDNTNQGGQLLTIFILTILGNLVNTILVSIATPSITFMSLIQSGALWEILLDVALSTLFYVILRSFTNNRRSKVTMFGS